MGDSQAPSQTSSDRPTTLGVRVLVELVRLVAILTLVGCAGGLVWVAPLAWEGRPQTWWGVGRARRRVGVRVSPHTARRPAAGGFGHKSG